VSTLLIGLTGGLGLVLPRLLCGLLLTTGNLLVLLTGFVLRILVLLLILVLSHVASPVSEAMLPQNRI